MLGNGKQECSDLLIDLEIFLLSVEMRPSLWLLAWFIGETSTHHDILTFLDKEHPSR